MTERFSSPDYSPATPEHALDGLVHSVELRLAEAISYRQGGGNLVWLLNGTDPRTAEDVVWLRLGQTDDIGQKNEEEVVIGVVVRDHAAEVPTPVRFSPDEAHFYIAESSKGVSKVTRVDITNARNFDIPDRWHFGLKTAADSKTHGLSWKLENYKIHPFRTKTAIDFGIDGLTVA